MPTATFDLISTVTVGTATSTVTFSGLTSTYNHYRIWAMPRLTTLSDNIVLRLNSDATSKYTALNRGAEQGGSPAEGVVNTAITNINLNYNSGGQGLYTDTGAGSLIVDILDASNTNWFKTVHSYLSTKDSAAAGGLTISSGNYASTNAVTAINIVHTNTNFAVGSVFSLYGLVS